jgi:LacI family gluconate utilization system Gnt-I transcriptional repressor
LQALTESLAAAGYQLILGQSRYDDRREEAILNTMIGRRPDGIVVTGLVQSEHAGERLKRLGIPVAVLHRLGGADTARLHRYA